MTTPSTGGSTSDVPTTRICRKCSVQNSTAGEFCPNCGTRYVQQSRRPSRKAVVIGVVALVLVAAAGTALAVKHHNDSAAQDRAIAAKARAAKQHAAAAAEADDAERASRRKLVKSLEKQITKDAKGLVKTAVLDGPIRYSSCTATGGGSTDDLTALTGTFDCIAVNKENKDDTVSGYAYHGTIEWGTGSLTWQLGN